MTMASTTPLMMTVEQFAELHSVSETTVRSCIRGESDTYPPLNVKRVSKPGGGKSFIYITAEQAAEWRAALPDA
jgi:predicted transcriptional regulator